MAKTFSGRLYGMISVGNESSTDGLFLQLQDLSVLTAAGFRAKPVSCGIRKAHQIRYIFLIICTKQ